MHTFLHNSSSLSAFGSCVTKCENGRDVWHKTYRPASRRTSSCCLSWTWGQRPCQWCRQAPPWTPHRQGRWSGRPMNGTLNYNLDLIWSVLKSSSNLKRKANWPQQCRCHDPSTEGASAGRRPAAPKASPSWIQHVKTWKKSFKASPS